MPEFFQESQTQEHDGIAGDEARKYASENGPGPQEMVRAHRRSSESRAGRNDRAPHHLVGHRHRVRYVAALTRREAEIARLVARGHTNSAIAAMLAISMRSVEQAVRGVCSMLHIESNESNFDSSRTEEPAIHSPGRFTIMKRLLAILITSALAVGLNVDAAAAPNLSGHWTCLSYGASVRWFQDIVFRGSGRYALGDYSKPYDPGAYRIDGTNVIHFHSGGDKDFLGLYKGGAIYLKFRSDTGPFEKRGFGSLTFKCGRDRR